MGNKPYTPLSYVYERASYLDYIFDKKGKFGQQPLTFEDSLIACSNYPYSTFGLLTAEGKHGVQRGIAFVVADNFLLTCASNCYSHFHGEEYKSLTFAIDSNRKIGVEAYRIAKVFVPDQYKKLPQKQRDSFNFALLYIAGEPNLKDKYGSLGLSFENSQDEPLTYSQWVMQNQDQVRMVANHKMSEKKPIKLSGAPLIFSQYGYLNFAEGLSFQQSGNSQPSFLVFNESIFTQLSKSALVEYGCLDLGETAPNIIRWGLPILKKQKIKVKPLQKIKLASYLQGEQCIQILECIPFPSVYHLDISKKNLEDNHLTFLKMDKFRKLKELDLKDNNIGVLGCKYIAEASLDNLRSIILDENEIGSEGCGYLCKADWPFLSTMHLNDCKIGNQGLRMFSQQVRKNLINFAILDIKITNEGTIFMNPISFPRLVYLYLRRTSINTFGLQFIKSSWKQLKHLNLQRTNLGSKGCKLIKDSGLVLSQLWLMVCKINEIGMKWICKSDLSKIHQLPISLQSLLASFGYNQLVILSL